MVKNNESKVEITTRNIKYYKNKGFKCVIGDLISIDISVMPKMSHNIVIAICEICNTESQLMFSKYNKNKNRQGFYSCSKCSNIKRKKTNKEIYGVESITQLEYVRENNRKWMSSDDFKSKSKKTLLENYGVYSYSKTEEFKNNISEKMIDRIKKLKEDNIYFTSLSLPENKDKREKAMFEKYGATYSFNIPEIKEKIQMSNLEKFGHISPFGNLDIQKKIKERFVYKNLEKESYFNGDPYKINQFRLYRRKIRYKTNTYRNILFKNWDGYDYYDNEYIKEYCLEGSNNSKYPTIDHKISCFSGFINNIPIDIISDITNLCITKREINVMKGRLNESEFLGIIKH